MGHVYLFLYSALQHVEINASRITGQLQRIVKKMKPLLPESQCFVNIKGCI